MTFYDRLVRLLENGRITIPDDDIKIVPAVESACSGDDRTIQIPYDRSHPNHVETMAMLERVTQSTGISPTLLFDRGSPRGDATVYSVIIDDPLCPQSTQLKEQCRTCKYRNKDFDRPVRGEHLRDLKCAINPPYAMSGEGDCSDFVEDAAPPLSVADAPQALRHRITELPPGEIQVNLEQLLINAIRSMPRVAEIKTENWRTLSGWMAWIRVRTYSAQTIEYTIEPNTLTPSALEDIITFFRERVEGDR
jgi:hypothetical protein